ncbi:MAG: exopolysaccharide Pel transporter PelG [Chlamydiota bacterium]
MAGLGFVIRKLHKSDTLFNSLRAYFYGMMATSGPWIVTVVALGIYFQLTNHLGSVEENLKGRALVLYNFGFSLVLCSPVVVIANRYLSDGIFKGDLREALPTLLGAMFFVFLYTTPLVLFFYFYILDLTPLEALLSSYFFIIVAGVWLLNSFIACLKNYNGITLSFTIGMVACVVCSVPLVDYGAMGTVFGFGLGLSFTFASLLGMILAQYPKGEGKLFSFIPFFKSYWELCLGGLIYNAAIWVDKWILWFTPEATQLPSGLLMYPEYDGAMILSYLSIIPSLALFMVSQETYFLEHYYRYYEDIRNHASFRRIMTNHESLKSAVAAIARNTLIFQFSVATLLVLLAPKILVYMNMNVTQLGIFRFGVLGATFQITTTYLTILLSYCEERKLVLIIQAFLFVTNAIFTYLSTFLGFSYYGRGFPNCSQ